MQTTSDGTKIYFEIEHKEEQRKFINTYFELFPDGIGAGISISTREDGFDSPGFFVRFAYLNPNDLELYKLVEAKIIPSDSNQYSEAVEHLVKIASDVYDKWYNPANQAQYMRCPEVYRGVIAKVLEKMKEIFGI